MTGGYRIAAALVCGLIFSAGLSLSGMLDPTRVRGFLDIAGVWDPSLVFVLTGAVSVSAAGYQLVRHLRKPAFDSAFHLPATTPVDRRLLTGSALFGVGWGLSGLCPGPAVATLALGLLPGFGFVAAMLAGMILHDRLASHRRAEG